MRSEKPEIKIPLRFIGTFLLSITVISVAYGQISYIRAADLFPAEKPWDRSGRLNISHRPAIDTLISRYIYSNKLAGNGMEGYRIQIYRSSGRSAREESNKVRAQFMVDFPDIPSYAEYERPGYFLVRAGDFRTKMEGTKTLYAIRKKYPNSYMVPCIINFPDLDKY